MSDMNNISIWTKLYIFFTGALHENLDAVIRTPWLANHFNRKQAKVRARLEETKASVAANIRQYRRDVTNSEQVIKSISEDLVRQFGNASAEDLQRHEKVINQRRQRIEALRDKGKVSQMALDELTRTMEMLDLRLVEVDSTINRLKSVTANLQHRTRIAKDLNMIQDSIADLGEGGTGGDILRKMEMEADRQEELLEIRRPRADEVSASLLENHAPMDDEARARAAQSNADFLKSLTSNKPV